MARPGTVALDDRERGIVLDILHRLVPDREVWVYGSRAAGSVKPWSDLDLAIIGDIPLPPATLAALRDGFAQSDLPWRVDVLDWASTSETFRNLVTQGKAQLRKPDHGAP